MDLGDMAEHIVAPSVRNRVVVFLVDALQECPGDQEAIRFRE
jgi:hypothetical protein